MAKKQKDPAFLFYSKDWLEGTAEMTPEERGVYIDLLAHQHQRGGIPIDMVRLARMVRLSQEEFINVWTTISCKFDQIGDQLVNQRLSEAMGERAERAKKNRISGTFASILRKLKLNYSNSKIVALKSDFKADDYMEFEEKDIESEITNWCTKWLTK